MDTLRQWLATYAELPAPAWNALNHALHPTELAKGKYFQDAGRPADRMAFLESGALYARYADSHRKHCVAFSCLESVNRVVCDLAAFSGQHRATMDIIASEDCCLQVIRRDDLYQLYDHYPSIERLGRCMAEYSYARAMERIARMEMKNPARVADLLKHYKEVFQRFPGTLIGEYLGMDKHEVSRARAKLNGRARSVAKTRSTR